MKTGSTAERVEFTRLSLPTLAPTPPATVEALRQEFTTLYMAGKQLAESVASAARAFTTDERRAQELRFVRLQDIRNELEARQEAAAAAFGTTVQTPPNPQPGRVMIQPPQDAPGRAEFAAAELGHVAMIDAGDAARERQLFNLALQGNADAARQFASTSSGTAGGLLVPSSVAAPHLVRRNANKIRKAIAAMGAQTLYSADMVPLKIPIFDDEEEGDTQSETATSQTTGDPTVSGMSLDPTLWSSKGHWFSNTALYAPGYNMAPEIIKVLTRRIERGQENAWFAHIIANATVGLTLAMDDAILYSEITGWEHSLSSSYRTDAVLFLSPTAFQMFRQMVDDDGRPILELDPSQMLWKLHGFPIFETEALEAVGSANKIIGAIASVDALKVYDAGPQRIVLYEKDHTKPDQTGFELFQNGDFDFVRAGVRLLKTPAS